MKYYAYVISLLFFTFMFFYFNVNYSYLDLKDYLSTLLTISGMIFTIMGIWIAFLYPNALQRLVNTTTIENADFSGTLEDTKRLESLVASVLRSIFIATSIMLIYLAKIIITGFPFFQEYILFIKSFSLSFVIMLGVFQLESVFYVIYSNIMFVNDLHNKKEDREADNDF